MKRFNAIPKEDSNELQVSSKVYAKEAKFDIIASSEERAMELIEQEGENPNDFDFVVVFGAKDQMGRNFPESITEL